MHRRQVRPGRPPVQATKKPLPRLPPPSRWLAPHGCSLMAAAFPVGSLPSRRSVPPRPRGSEPTGRLPTFYLAKAWPLRVWLYQDRYKKTMFIQQEAFLNSSPSAGFHRQHIFPARRIGRRQLALVGKSSHAPRRLTGRLDHIATKSLVHLVHGQHQQPMFVMVHPIKQSRQHFCRLHQTRKHNPRPLVLIRGLRGSSGKHRLQHNPRPLVLIPFPVQFIQSELGRPH